MTTFRRKVLLQKLNTVAPALANNDIVPGYTHFLFTGDSIVTNNERIAISAPLRADFKGLLPPILLNHVKTNPLAKEVKIVPNGNGALMTIGNTEISMPRQPLEHYRFQMPTAMPQHHVPSTFLHAVEFCLQSVSKYATVPDQLGITLLQDGRDLRLFATNRSTISDVRVSPSPFQLPFQLERVILSTQFCEQMLRLARTAKVLRLAIFHDFALFAADDAVLYGKLVPLSNTPLDFVGVVKQHVPKNFASKAIPIPKGLPALVKRATHLTSIIGSETKTKIIVEDGMATVAAESERGQLRECLAMPQHPDAECKVNARLLMEGMRSGPDRVLFTEHCAILARGEHYLFIAAFDD